MRCTKKLSNMTLAICIATGVLTFGSSVSAGELALVKGDHSVDSVSKKELKKILLGKSKKWDNGDKVIIVTLESGDVHDAFLKSYAKKTSKQFTNYWRKMVFSGKGKMPKSFASEAELISFVAANSGAIGYIGSGTAHDGTKELKVE